MNGEDLVNLIIVLSPNNHLPAMMSRKQASDWIDLWFVHRDRVQKMGWWSRMWYLFTHWKQPSPMVNSVKVVDTNDVFSNWVVDADNILGMYVSEPGENYTKKLAEAQERLADSITRDMGRGEEWRGDEFEDQDDDSDWEEDEE